MIFSINTHPEKLSVSCKLDWDGLCSQRAL